MITLDEILQKVLSEQEAQVNIPALGKKEQVNKLDIKATQEGLWVYDHLTNKQKMYARVGNKYNIKMDMLNRDFGLKLTLPEYNKLIDIFNEIIKKYPDKAKGISYPPYDIHVTLTTKEDGTQAIKELNVEAPDEKETPETDRAR